MKKFPFKITWQQAQEIIDIACERWKELLFAEWGRDIVLRKDIYVTKEHYTRMRKACTASQHKLFDKIFGIDEPEWEPKPGDWVHWDGINPGVFQVIGKCDGWEDSYVLHEKHHNSCHISNLRPATVEEIRSQFDGVGYAVPLVESGALYGHHRRTVGKVYKIQAHEHLMQTDQRGLRLFNDEGKWDGSGFLEYNQCRPATKEEVEALTLFTAKKGDWIVFTDFGKMEWRKGYTLNKPYQLLNEFDSANALKDDDGKYRKILHYQEYHGVKFRLATEEEIKLATFPPDGTPCLVMGDIEGWILRFSAGNGEFYRHGKKSGSTHFWAEWIDLTKTPLDKLPVNS